MWNTCTDHCHSDEFATNKANLLNSQLSDSRSSHRADVSFDSGDVGRVEHNIVAFNLQNDGLGDGVDSKHFALYSFARYSMNLDHISIT